MRRLTLTIAASVVALAGATTPSLAQTEIQWWHAMGGALGEWVTDLAEGFNESQTEYKVTPVYKGTYAEAMTAAVAAFRSGEPPHIVQVFEVGTATMMAAKGAVYPVHELMAETGTAFDPDAYLPAVAGYYTTADGKLLSLPFNSSTPVMYYNKEAFEKAGLDPENPPRTWAEFGDAAKKIRAAGYACGFTSAWQGWIQIENLSAWHDMPIATRSNGFEGFDTELRINSPLHVRHIAQMAEWQKDKTFDYGGRQGDSENKFISGECGMFFNSSAGLAAIRKNAQFPFGIAMLPYYDDVEGAPQNSIIGGATLWVMKGRSDAEYKGVAEFFNYLSSTEVQAASHQRTGYLPITTAAYELTREQGFYEQNPGADLSIRQITLNPPTANSKGLRLGNFVQIREIVNEELELVWGGQKTAEQALNDAVERGNAELRRFERTAR